MVNPICPKCGLETVYLIGGHLCLKCDAKEVAEISIMLMEDLLKDK